MKINGEVLLHILRILTNFENSILGSLASFDTSSVLNTEGVPLLEETEFESASNSVSVTDFESVSNSVSVTEFESASNSVSVKEFEFASNSVSVTEFESASNSVSVTEFESASNSVSVLLFLTRPRISYEISLY
jgi:hypothetical protein